MNDMVIKNDNTVIDYIIVHTVHTWNLIKWPNFIIFIIISIFVGFYILIIVIPLLLFMFLYPVVKGIISNRKGINKFTQLRIFKEGIELIYENKVLVECWNNFNKIKVFSYFIILFRKNLLKDDNFLIINFRKKNASQDLIERILRDNIAI